MPGFVDGSELTATIGAAMCLVLPSEREGYGLVVIEAASLGTPTIVVRGPDNAAVELIEQGVNGYVVEQPDPSAIADAILAVRAAGAELRRSTCVWFADNADALSAGRSAHAILERYAPTSRPTRRSGRRTRASRRDSAERP